MIPLLALRTFVEVGKMGSIKAAAQVLHVTSGAVSQQIRLLEARMDTRLFIRQRFGVTLTETGAKLYPQLANAFKQIDQALATVKSRGSQSTLTISTVPSLAASWLVPRLGQFTQRYPKIEVRVEATSKLVDFKRDNVDIALRHGLGHYPNLTVTWLMAPVLIPVASPRLLNTALPINDPLDCLNYPLLQDADRADWTLWLAALDIKTDPRSERGPSFDDDYLLIKAAESGQGIALVDQSSVQAELIAGRLVQVLRRSWPTQFAYYVVSDPDSTNSLAIDAFTRWIVDEANQDIGVNSDLSMA